MTQIPPAVVASRLINLTHSPLTSAVPVAAHSPTSLQPSVSVSTSSSPSRSSSPPLSPPTLQRKLRKNRREKQRRSVLNEKYDTLQSMLHISGLEKYLVLENAITALEDLKAENAQLKQQLAELRGDAGDSEQQQTDDGGADGGGEGGGDGDGGTDGEGGGDGDAAQGEGEAGNGAPRFRSPQPAGESASSSGAAESKEDGVLSSLMHARTSSSPLAPRLPRLSAATAAASAGSGAQSSGSDPAVNDALLLVDKRYEEMLAALREVRETREQMVEQMAGGSSRVAAPSLLMSISQHAFAAAQSHALSHSGSRPQRSAGAARPAASHMNGSSDENMRDEKQQHSAAASSSSPASSSSSSSSSDSPAASRQANAVSSLLREAAVAPSSTTKRRKVERSTSSAESSPPPPADAQQQSTPPQPTAAPSSHQPAA